MTTKTSYEAASGELAGWDGHAWVCFYKSIPSFYCSTRNGLNSLVLTSQKWWQRVTELCGAASTLELMATDFNLLTLFILGVSLSPAIQNIQKMILIKVVTQVYMSGTLCVFVDHPNVCVWLTIYLRNKLLNIIVTLFGRFFLVVLIKLRKVIKYNVNHLFTDVKYWMGSNLTPRITGRSG